MRCLNKNFHQRNRKQSFTLIELLITTVLIFVVISGFIILEETGGKFFKSVSEKSSFQANANYALERMVRRIRESSAFQISADKSSLTLWDQDNYQIFFTLDKKENVLYYLDERYGPEILLKNVSALRFEEQEGGKVIFIALVIKFRGKEAELSSRASLRKRLRDAGASGESCTPCESDVECSCPLRVGIVPKCLLGCCSCIDEGPPGI
ncbi:MAG: prepilin-type N-terminal cleavage/methylation domain-containing protein [Candidatus Omnitrophica bacterium]|nr:prepilin-type N-terminal cleavage/methylation domain-containing protein [Candidatus Omnitrophota bacterium]